MQRNLIKNDVHKTVGRDDQHQHAEQRNILFPICVTASQTLAILRNPSDTGETIPLMIPGKMSTSPLELLKSGGGMLLKLTGGLVALKCFNPKS